MCGSGTPVTPGPVDAGIPENPDAGIADWDGSEDSSVTFFDDSGLAEDSGAPDAGGGDAGPVVDGSSAITTQVHRR